MKKNMGSIDRIVRTLIALTIIILYFTNVLSGTAAIVLLVISAVFILTSIVGFCPLYFPFGIHTNGKSQNA